MDGMGMERIKKPLQLAGHDRSGAPEVVTEFSGDNYERMPRIAESAIEYTETRVIDVGGDVFERTRVVTGRTQGPIANAYRLLRTQVLQQLQSRDWQTVAVVSPCAGEGKTLTGVNLAINLASAGSHTSLLVDLDWYHPSVHKHFEYTPAPDVRDCLRGERTLAETIVNPGLPRFCFLPCAESADDPPEYLGSLGGFVRELKNRYTNRIVLFDLPPLLATDDALSFLPLVDCALLVVEEGRTKRDDVARSIELIGAERLLGTVLNKSWHRPSRY